MLQIYLLILSLRSPEHIQLLDKLMHLADLDENGSIDKDELTHSTKALSLLEKYYDEVDKDFLTKEDMAKLIPELNVLEDLVNELETCLSSAVYDPFLRNRKMKPVNFFIYFSFKVLDGNKIFFFKLCNLFSFI